MSARLRIATRGSRLALWQTHHVADALRARTPDLTVELIEVTTKGDAVRDRALSEVGTSGLFTKELESYLLEGRADIAVHSSKDMETTLPDGLALICVPERADPRDCLVTASGSSLEALPAESLIGTSSIRRRAQLQALRPDLRFTTIRGNVPTRLDKLMHGDAGIVATVLARAGLERLLLFDERAHTLPATTMLPAVGQGAMAIEARADDARVASLVAPLDHTPTHQALIAERAWLRTLHGGCQIPAGALATVDQSGRLEIEGLVARLDGSEVLRGTDAGDAAQAESIGERLAQALLARGADAIIAEATATQP